MHATKPLTEEATVRYAIDPAKSTFLVQVFSTGLLSAFGHDPKIAIRDFQGEAEFVNAGLSLQEARMHMRIVADSLEVTDDISDRDREEIHSRMSTEVLEVSRFPEVLYVCSKVTGSGSGDRYWIALQGDLTLHGVTRIVPVSARLVVDGDSLRASGEFTIRQRDFEIAPVTAAAGTIRVKDELKCTFDIVARKRE